MFISRSLAIIAVALIAGCQSQGPGKDVTLTRSKADPGVTPEAQKKMADEKAKVPLAMEMLATPKPAAMLTITSAAFANGGTIPATYADYGEKSSPPLKIAGVPASAKSIVIIVDDPDAMDPKPFVHWVLYNLPPNMTEIRTAVPGTGQVRELGFAKQGPNSFGSSGYFGPHPPAGDPPHHYYFQVFALDRMLDLEQAAKKDEVITAAKGHVVAAGELLGLFQQPKPK